jgi:hypothetical protein
MCELKRESGWEGPLAYALLLHSSGRAGQQEVHK